MKRILFVAIFVMLTQSLCFAEPVAKFNEFAFDFGNVSNTDQDKVEHVFEFSNTGSDDLLIQRLVLPSGSAKASATSTVIKPGENGGIKVEVDVRGKKGIYSKRIDVHTNDPMAPIISLSVKMSVNDRIHMSQYKPAEIFAEDCSSCHVEQGKGKMGWDLFKADCFMCHNAGRNTSLTTMSKKPAGELLKSISQGVQNTLMPGFDQKYGGPLNEAEIASLVELITQ